jgi:hypothetical protein
VYADVRVLVWVVAIVPADHRVQSTVPPDGTVKTDVQEYAESHGSLEYVVLVWHEQKLKISVRVLKTHQSIIDLGQQVTTVSVPPPKIFREEHAGE